MRSNGTAAVNRFITDDLEKARTAIENMPGWLLELDDGTYLVTDDVDYVRQLRGQEFIDRCEERQWWDETSDPGIFE